MLPPRKGPLRYDAVPREGPPKVEEASLDGRILSIALPSLLALSLDPLLGTIDTAFVGRLSESSAVGLAALGVSFSTFGLIYPSTNFLSNAATPLVAQSRDGRLASSIVLSGLALGFALCAGVEVCAPWLVATVGGVDRTNGDVFDAALSFARIRALSAPAVAVTNSLNGCLRGLGDVASPLRGALVAAGANFALDCVLVPRAGANGAAIATVSAETLGAFVLAVAFASTAAAPTALSMQALRPFATNALLTLARTLSLQLFLAACTRAVGLSGGEAALAAHHTLRSLYTLLSFATDALAIAAQQLIAAEADPAEKRAIARRLGLWGLGVGTFFAAGLAAGAGPIVAFLDADDRVQDFATPRVRFVLAPLQILSSLVFVADGILQGNLAFGFEAKAMAASTLLAAAALVPAANAISPGDVLDVVWHAVVVLQLARALTFAIWWMSTVDYDSQPRAP